LADGGKEEEVTARGERASPSNDAFLTETELAKCGLSFTTFTSSIGTLAILAYA